MTGRPLLFSLNDERFGHRCSAISSPYIRSLLSSCGDSCYPYSRAKLVAFPGRSTCRMFSEPQLVAESSLTPGKLREFEEQ